MQRQKLIKNLMFLAENCNNIQVESILYSVVLSMKMDNEKKLGRLCSIIYQKRNNSTYRKIIFKNSLNKTNNKYV